MMVITGVERVTTYVNHHMLEGTIYVYPIKDVFKLPIAQIEQTDGLMQVFSVEAEVIIDRVSVFEVPCGGMFCDAQGTFDGHAFSKDGCAAM